MEQHFGKWLKKVRGRARLNQRELAQLVSLESYTTISTWEKLKTPEMNDANREALMDVLGYESEEMFEADWKAGTVPDLGRIMGLAELSPHPLLEELAAESKVTAGAWSRGLFEWLGQQTPEFQKFIRDSVWAAIRSTAMAKPRSDSPGSGRKHHASTQT